MDNDILSRTILEFLKYALSDDCEYILHDDEFDLIFISKWVNEIWAKDQL